MSNRVVAVTACCLFSCGSGAWQPPQGCEVQAQCRWRGTEGSLHVLLSGIFFARAALAGCTGTAALQAMTSC